MNSPELPPPDFLPAWTRRSEGTCALCAAEQKQDPLVPVKVLTIDSVPQTHGTQMLIRKSTLDSIYAAFALNKAKEN